jgi:hypothetical protein
MLNNPNTWLSQAQYFRDPPRITEYLDANCEGVDVADPVLRDLAVTFVEDFDNLSADDTLTVCLDTNNYIQDYARYVACCEPQQPAACLPVLSFHAMNSCLACMLPC